MESSNKRRKKSRWGGDDKVVIPGLPTNLPVNLSAEQERIYLLQLQIEDLTRRLRTGDLEIPTNPEERSPSPEPIYNNEGKRLNTREFRTRKKLEDERHNFIQEMVQINPSFKPPSDYKPPQQKISEKVLIPQEEYPEINFVGLLIGPRGNTLKGMEKDSGAKIIIRGKGSVKEGKIGRKDGQPMPGEDEPLHAFVTASTHESVLKAVQKIKDVIRQGIEVPENQNDLRKNQLRELALLNGTLRETDGPKCFNCGSSAHRSWQCPDKPNVTNNVICSNCGAKGHISKDCKEKKAPQNANSSKIDEEYLSLMAELGEGPRPPKMNHSSGGGGSGNNSGGGGGSGPNFSGPGGPPRAIMAGSGPRDSHGPSHSQSHHPVNPHHSNVQQNGSWSRNDNQSVVQPPYWQSTQNPTAYGYGSSAGVSPSTAYPQMPAVDSYSYMYSQTQTASSNPWLQQGWSQNANMTVVPSPPPPPPPPDGQRTTTTPGNSTSWMGYMNIAGVSSIGLNAPPPPPPPPSVPTIPASLYVAPPPPPPPPPPPS